MHSLFGFVVGGLGFFNLHFCVSLEGFIGLPGSKGTQGEQVSDGTHTTHGSGCGTATLEQPKAPASCYLSVFSPTLE